MSEVARMTAWERWEMGAVGAVGAAGVVAAARAADTPSATGRANAALRAVAAPAPGRSRLPLQDARLPPGYAAGHAQGLASGLAEGLADGRAQGLEQGRVEGLAQGLAQGLAEGLAEGRAAAQAAARQTQHAAQAELAAACAPLRDLALSLPRAWQAAEQAMAQDLLALALTLAQQVLGQSLAVDPSGLLPTVRALLQAEPALSGHPKLLLHPDDLALVQAHLADDLHSAGWSLRADPQLQRGGCRVIASSGELDATLSTRWARVASRLPLPLEHAAAPAPAAPHGS